MKKLSLSTLEIVASLLLVIYLLVDVSTPNYMKSILKTQMGMIMLLVLLVLIGLNANPLVTLLVIFAAYEMVRRSLLEGFEESGEGEGEGEDEGEDEGEVKYDDEGRTLGPDGQPLPDSDKGDHDEPEQNNLPDQVDISEGFQNLETEIVKDMAPVGKSNKIVYNVSSYKPVENNVTGTSMFV
tara:strand:+ start:660 stop:1208 length:549 start_codon:yes stop_codon:yes gene_type:complete